MQILNFVLVIRLSFSLFHSPSPLLFSSPFPAASIRQIFRQIFFPLDSHRNPFAFHSLGNNAFLCPGGGKPVALSAALPFLHDTRRQFYIIALYSIGGLSVKIASSEDYRIIWPYKWPFFPTGDTRGNIRLVHSRVPDRTIIRFLNGDR